MLLEDVFTADTYLTFSLEMPSHVWWVASLGRALRSAHVCVAGASSVAPLGLFHVFGHAGHPCNETLDATTMEVVAAVCLPGAPQWCDEMASSWSWLRVPSHAAGTAPPIVDSHFAVTPGDPGADDPA